MVVYTPWLLSKCSQRSHTHIASFSTISAHIVPDSLVVQYTLHTANSTDGNVLIPNLVAGKSLHIIRCDSTNNALNLLRASSSASGNQLSSNVLGNGCCAVKRQQKRCLELRLGALDLAFCNTVAQSRPVSESEVNKIVQTRQLVRNHVNTPQTGVGV